LIKIFTTSILTVLLFSFICIAQTPPAYHYTSADGLASSSVFSMLQDRDGYMWFGTLQGVSRFDGKHFKTYNSKDGLNSNSIVSIASGSEGEIYAATYENGINIIKNGKIENWLKYPSGKQFPITYLHFLENKPGKGKLFSYKNSGPYFEITKGKDGKGEAKSLNLKTVYINRFGFLSDGTILIAARDGLFFEKDGNFSRRIVTGLPREEMTSIFVNRDGSYYVGARGKIYKIVNDTVSETHTIDVGTRSQDVIEIFCDSRNNLWFSLMNNGFHLLRHNDSRTVNMGKKFNLESTHVNGFLEDREGNIWVSAFGKGVFCLNNLYATGFDESDGLSSENVNFILKDNSSRLYVATFDGLNALEDDSFKRVGIFSTLSINEYIYNIKSYDGEIFVCGVFGIKWIKRINYQGQNVHLITRTAFCKTSKGLSLFGYGNNIIFVRKGFTETMEDSVYFTLFGDTLSVNRINEIVEDTFGNVWIATGVGLCMVKDISIKGNRATATKRYFKDIPVLNCRINSIWLERDKKVWFATERGVANYDLVTGEMTAYSNLAGMDLAGSNSVVTDNKGRIWIGTMRGLFLYDHKEIIVFNRNKGLKSNEVVALFYDSNKNSLFTGTNGGVSAIDLNIMDDYPNPTYNAVITEIKSANKVLTGVNDFELERDYGDLFIRFSALNFASPGSVRYRYKLGGDWVETENDFINLLSLSPGKYKLEVQARDMNGSWGKSAEIKFSVLPGFFESTLFKVLVILFFVFTGPLILRWRLAVQKKKNISELELTERINELKHQALSAMMNPHFVFNSLNSVQYLINSNKNEEANDYIAMMAKLMRMNLETAGSGFILLAEEINRLTLYLNLEKLRLGEKFNWQINTFNGVDPARVMIPNMIIQPFVENSIWHGIIESGKNGMLNISFQFEEMTLESVEEKALVIKVTDNGIGIKQAKINKKVDHISKGIEIVEERLRLLSSKMEIPQPILFEDLGSRGPESQGTEIVISLPSSLYRIKNKQS
jgi:ligand-binding sensor domain-containing protein